MLYGKTYYTKRSSRNFRYQHCNPGRARNNGLISYVQYVQNGCVYFTSAGLQEYIAKCTHRAKPAEKNATYRRPRRAGV